MRLFFILLGFMNRNLFFTDMDSSRDFVIDNFSNSITKDNPTQIYFTRSEKNLSHLFLSFIPNSDASKDYDIKATVLDRSGNVVAQQVLNAESIFGGNSANISVTSTFRKGETLSLLLETDAKDEECGWRIPTGKSEHSDINYWTYNGITDSTIIPGLHIVYNHFGLKTFALWLICAVMSLFLSLIPKSEKQRKIDICMSRLIFLTVPLANICLSEFCNFSSIMSKGVGVIVFGSVTAIALQIIFLAILPNTGFAVIASSILITVFSIANHYTRLFRGGVLTYFDLKVANTAANVISQYKFELDIPVLITLTALIVIILASVRFSFSINLKNKIITRAAALIIGLGLIVFSVSDRALKISGGHYNAYSSSESADNLGVFYSFCHGISTAKLEKPEGYSTKAISEKASEYISDLQFDGEKPDIILIMNETLTDFSKSVNLDTTSDPLEYIHYLENDNDPRTFVGSVVTPVFGGGTCNTEFEAITGLSMANFLYGCYPYAQYITDNTYSFARYASSLGYQTTFMHPGNPRSYNRSNAYSLLGFDNIMFADDFVNPEIVRNFITDKSCYDEITKLLNSSQDPQFIFNVTIQNHGAWYYPEFEKTVWINSGKNDDSLLQLEVLLSLYQKSDIAFKEFIEKIQSRDKPTLVIMFGDHLPALDSYSTSYIHLDSAIEQNPLVKYRTPIVIISNYDIDLSVIPTVFSTNYISAYMTKVSGLPLSGYYNYLLRQADSAPVYSPIGSFDSQSQPISLSGETALYSQIQYAALKEYKQLPPGFFTVFQ
ncbi:MAG: LTA synthase family protein [Oscillospiraceae bacterium]|nr:LTA synthase family protein [Oscillospiraceae bacterium]